MIVHVAKRSCSCISPSRRTHCYLECDYNVLQITLPTQRKKKWHFKLCVNFQTHVIIVFEPNNILRKLSNTIAVDVQSAGLKPVNTENISIKASFYCFAYSFRSASSLFVILLDPPKCNWNFKPVQQSVSATTVFISGSLVAAGCYAKWNCSLTATKGYLIMIHCPCALYTCKWNLSVVVIGWFAFVFYIPLLLQWCSLFNALYLTITFFSF